MSNQLNNTWLPDLTVAAICERDGQFLMVEERSKSTQQIVFNQPAGHLEDNESIIQAVVREVREETCRHFTPQALIGLYRIRTALGKTYIRYTFSGDISGIDPDLTLDPDIIATHWLSAKQILQHPALRSTITFDSLQDYLKGKRYPLDILCDDISN